MAASKELLRETIERLDEADAHRALTFVRTLLEPEAADVFDALNGDALIEVPAERAATFPLRIPVAGLGVSASRRLIEDRR